MVDICAYFSFVLLSFLYGNKIHATIREQLLYLLQKKLIEGEVYKMSYFSVVPLGLGIGSVWVQTPYPKEPTS